MYFSTMKEWLTWIAQLHHQEMDLGLARIKPVAEALAILSPQMPVIVVGGTNGKGSTVAILSAIYQSAGYCVGELTSPYFWRINEQVKINGKEIDDSSLMEAFARVEEARNHISLTPFEFFTLAAIWLLKKAHVDILLLEVGLGGRLDAVNVMDCDVAIVTNISMDHMDVLGDTREKIAVEKAGIFRANKPAICGEECYPSSLKQQAGQINAHFYALARDFSYTLDTTGTWTWQSESFILKNLPPMALRLDNASAALMAVNLLQERLNVPETALRKGLHKVRLIGRVERLAGDKNIILDVAHNPEAVRHLALAINEPALEKTYAVFSMLKDKEILDCVLPLKNIIKHWYVAPLEDKRGASLEQLQAAFQQANITQVSFFKTIPAAYAKAIEMMAKEDRLVVYGSFRTIASAVRPTL